MALADYFERNAQAVTSLIKHYDVALLAQLLHAQVIGIAFDGNAERNKESVASIDLTIRLVARLYPTVAICGLKDASRPFVEQMVRLARAINPKIDVTDDVASATKLLVFGDTEVSAVATKWYVGSDKWIAKLSTTAPVGAANSGNPFGAGVAACIGVANVFRSVFAAELGNPELDVQLETSAWTLQAVDRDTPNPEIADVALHDVHLVGAGAIGHGLLWALSRLRCHGTLHVIDAEQLSDTNLQRYVMAMSKNKDVPKVELAQSILRRNTRLKVIPHRSTWADHIGQTPDHKAHTVLSAVDSAKARIQIQASLPFRIFNGWTQRGEAGVSRHHFLDGKACLACLYMPQGQAVNEDVMVTQALKLGDDEATVKEVRRRLQQAVPTEHAFLERISRSTCVPIEKLKQFEGRSLKDFYVEAVCGGRVMEFHAAALQAKAEVPMGFQSALSGLLLAAELVRPEPMRHTVTQIDLLGTYPERPGTPRAKSLSPRCLCLDEDFVEVFKEKYPASVRAPD